ncbi:hypothetical protein [Microbulbifer yueqingensis]|uniref:Uncharacterized protein n=1 Tax=Microbulbifer yueqingensis TaxID=658219 RepID=A0A1G8ZM44_9GAMM|nr:hypothetical protein [Microbulbifer yueqingensis]SDK15220.1 hypothetical protein SAMN05216212_1651 [Microbulbifer yueqingensis]
MPWMKWLPWRFFVRKFATSHGFLDPLSVMAHLQRFAQPSEVAEPIELLRAGVIFHARALINSKVIQHNLDWVWPYWVERQFDPLDSSFIPRAFSITHCNLSHRNWTAVGLPDCEEMPVIDPRGLLTPHYDGWSIDTWVVNTRGEKLLPSKLDQCRQQLEFGENISVLTETAHADMRLQNRAFVEQEDGAAHCRLRLQAESASGGWLIVALRPYNPEGVSFVHKVRLDNDRRNWLIEDKYAVEFDRALERHLASDYHHGDIFLHLQDEGGRTHGECEVGMATAGAMFRIEPGQALPVEVRIPLKPEKHRSPTPLHWGDTLTNHCAMSIPDEKLQFLYDAAIRTLILHSPKDVYPGPYTYKRFWFRDAAFMIQSLLYAGLVERAERALDQFPHRQKRDGFFHSQDGEWDSNGEALWIFDLFCQLTNQPLKQGWRDPVLRGASWIDSKRLPKDGSRCGGLLPAGFSAEHLGPNDCYYWDDFWGVGGLHAAAAICEREGMHNDSSRFAGQARDFQQTIDESLAAAAERLGRAAMPASPNRRLDPGAIGSVAAGYPLHLYPADDPRLLDLAEFLMDNCFVSGGFFQDMIHSGINAYLTLHIAQLLLRAGDARCVELMRNVAQLASPTGQWPEAIHPHSFGGCMGDGQHAWAAAEWVAMQRNCFVREEGDTLVLVSGLPPEWLSDQASAHPIHFGPALTRFGRISLEVAPGASPRVSWMAEWHRDEPPIEVRALGFAPVRVPPGSQEVELTPQ